MSTQLQRTRGGWDERAPSRNETRPSPGWVRRRLRRARSGPRPLRFRNRTEPRTKLVFGDHGVTHAGREREVPADLHRLLGREVVEQVRHRRAAQIMRPEARDDLVRLDVTLKQTRLRAEPRPEMADLLDRPAVTVEEPRYVRLRALKALLDETAHRSLEVDGPCLAVLLHA